MERDGGRRPRLGPGPGAVGGLALVEDAAADGGRRVKIGGIAAGLAPGGLHVGDGRAGMGDAARRVHEARAELGGEPARPRAHRRDVQGDRVVQVDGPDLRIQEPDLPLLSLEGPLESLARRGGRARRGRTLPCLRASPARAPGSAAP